MLFRITVASDDPASMANHTIALLSLHNQTVPPIVSNNATPTAPESFQTLLFGVLGVGLTLGSVYIAYLQLKHTIRQNSLRDVEMGVVGQTQTRVLEEVVDNSIASTLPTESRQG